ncbi:MAG: hypothetical protein WEE64_06080 [Dehalococcoidia bacterium]
MASGTASTAGKQRGVTAELAYDPKVRFTDFDEEPLIPALLDLREFKLDPLYEIFGPSAPVCLAAAEADAAQASEAPPDTRRNTRGETLEILVPCHNDCGELVSYLGDDGIWGARGEEVADETNFVAASSKKSVTDAGTFSSMSSSIAALHS